MQAFYKEVANFVVPIGREGNELSNGINHPAKKLFKGGPIRIPELQFLNGVGGLAVSVFLIIWAEQQIQGVENVSPYLTELRCGTLVESQEIINKDVAVSEGIPSRGRSRGRQARGLRK
jgi:hypothetical protein